VLVLLGGEFLFRFHRFVFPTSFVLFTRHEKRDPLS
jgi:hypothetical protein